MRTLRRLVKLVLPTTIKERIRRLTPEWREFTQVELRELDLSRLELIRSARLSDLSDPNFLEHELLPRLGLNDEALHELPRSLHQYTGQGLYTWQYPNQFGPYLARLSQLGIDSYLEIGTRHGGTFLITIEYLSRFKPLRRVVGIDLGVPSNALREYAAERPNVTVLQGNSRGSEFKKLVREQEPFDLVLVDGDHSEIGCRADLKLVRSRSNVLVLHDIVSDGTPGVRKVWAEFKRAAADRYDFTEFTDQYDEVGTPYIGIGLAVPHGWHAQSV